MHLGGSYKYQGDRISLGECTFCRVVGFKVHAIYWVSFARKNMWVYEAANFHFFIYIYLKGWLVGGKARIYLTYQIEINMTSEKNG